MSGKPLIFLYPLSETLQKLKESFEGQENVEIFEVDALSEAIQIFQSSAPAVVLCSDPKKMIQFQAVNKRIIAKTSSKTILISGKTLNPKAQRKFDQLGLSDFIKEPIPGKTLYYKINLLLKSLPRKLTEEDQNYNLKEGQYEEEETEANLKLKNKNQKEEDLGGYLRADLKPKQEEVELDLYDKKESKPEESITDMEKKFFENEESLGGYYEGDGDGDLQDLGGQMASKDSKKEDPNLDELNGKLKNGHTDKEQDLLSDITETDKNLGENLSLKSEKELNLEEDEPVDDIQNEIPELGEIEDALSDINLNLEDEKELNAPKTKELEAEEIDNQKSTSLDLLEDKEISLEKEKLLEPEEKESSRSKKLDLEDEEPDLESNLKELNSPEEIEGNRKSSLDIEEEEEESRRQKHLEEILKDSNRKSNFDEAAIDGSQKGESSTDNIDQSDMKGRNFQEADRPDATGSAKTEQLEQKALQGKLSRQQVNEKEGKERELSTLDPDLVQEKKKKDLPIVEKESKEKELKSDASEEAESKNQRFEKEDAIDSMAKGKLGPSQKEEEKKPKKQLRSKEPDNPESLKKDLAEQEFEDNWDIEQDPEQNLPTEMQVDGDKEAFYGKNEDLGEQTIDYKKIKKAYEEGTSGDEAFQEDGNFDKHKEVYTFDVVETGPYTITLEPEVEESTVLLSPEEEVKKGSKDFIPDTKGFEFIIQRLEDYRDKGKSEHDIFYQVTKVLKEKQGGYCTFFINRSGLPPVNGANLETWFSMHDLFGDEDPEVFESWTLYKADEMSNWINAKFPTWKDHTFQANQNYFIFPYYDGNQFQGLAVVTFQSSKAKEDTGFIEAQLESVRSIYLEQFVEPELITSKPQQIEEESLIDNNETLEKKGFLKKIFSRAS